MFINDEINEFGCYMIAFYMNGVKRIVLVDDWIPTRYGKPAFAKGVDNECWVILLEKAWAKLNGTYCRSESGNASWSCFHTLGVPN